MTERSRFVDGPLQSHTGPRDVAPLLAVFLSRAVSVSLFAPCLPGIARTLGVSYEGAGSLVGVFFVGYTLAVAVAGPVSRILGRRGMLLVGTGLLGLSAASVGFATEMWLARIAAFAFGAAGLGDMTATVLLAERGGERSGRLLAWGHGAFAIGAVATPVLAGVALEAGTSYPLLFAAAAVLNLSIFLWNALVPVPGEVRAAVSVPGLATGRESLFRQPLFLFGMVVIALYLGGEAALTIWLPTWILDRFGASEGIASASVAVFWVSMASARLGLGPVLERYDRRVVIVGMSGASALASVWLLVSASLVPAFIGVALAGLSMSLVVPLLQSAMAGAFPRSAVPVIGWLAVAAGTAGSVSPWVVGAMAETFQQRPDMSAGGGLTLALWLVPAAFGATAVAALRLRRP